LQRFNRSIVKELVVQIQLEIVLAGRGDDEVVSLHPKADVCQPILDA
jgi:hypothetical protein